jgi:hypothetical protein
MPDAPERLRLAARTGFAGQPDWDEVFTTPGGTEYVRADIHNATLALLRKLEYCMPTESRFVTCCPICWFRNGQGHNRDCQLGTILRKSGVR